MNQPNAGQSAYPLAAEVLDRCGDGTVPTGLTKRELIAAMAMQSVIRAWGSDPVHMGEISKRSVMHADALLSELDKTQNEK